MVRRFLMFALVGGSLSLAGCNTMQGLGQDIGSAGQALETAATR